MNDIAQIVESEISLLCDDFKNSPYLYFTENDLICTLYGRLQDKLGSCTIEDRRGKKHSLIHTEYATPFRCDMKGSRFEIKSDDERTEKGGKYRRGHYDLVVLNPDFVKASELELIQGQNYQKIRGYLDNAPENPIILYGLECMYSRSEIKCSRGSDCKKGVDEYIKKIRQDLAKLEESKKRPYCMSFCKMVVFLRGNEQKMNDYIESQFSKQEGIELCYSKTESQ